MAKLTYQQKLDALSYRFYQHGQWTPKAGDYYTTSRSDLELYQVVSIKDGIVRTRFTEGSDAISEWPEDGFLNDGFGPKRVLVPEWVMNAPRSTKSNTEVLECLVEARRHLNGADIDLAYIDEVIAKFDTQLPQTTKDASHD